MPLNVELSDETVNSVNRTIEVYLDKDSSLGQILRRAVWAVELVQRDIDAARERGERNTCNDPACFINYTHVEHRGVYLTTDHHCTSRCFAPDSDCTVQ